MMSQLCFFWVSGKAACHVRKIVTELSSEEAQRGKDSERGKDARAHALHGNIPVARCLSLALSPGETVLVPWSGVQASP